MSSFQIELTPSLAPTIGVLLNVSPDHLDRHGTMEHYAGLKARLVRGAAPHRRRGRRLVPRHRRAPAPCRPQLGRSRLGRARVAHGWYADGTELVARAPWTGPLGAFADLAGIGSLRGRHNIQNALAASAAAMPRCVARASGRRPDDISRPAASSGGDRPARARRSSSTTARPPTPTVPLPRSPPSSATSIGSWGASPRRAASAARAVFPAHRQGLPDRRGQRGVRSDARRQGPLRALRHARCASRRFARCGVGGAAEPVVLLSPACASYDQFPNFEVRGDAFRALVEKLPGIELRRQPDMMPMLRPREGRSLPALLGRAHA